MGNVKNSSYDVIVVGAGNAALCAALSAREQVENVLVLERAPREKRGGNSAFTGGGFRMVHRGLEDVQKLVPDLSADEIARTDFGAYTAEQFLDDLGRITQYYIDPDLAEVLVENSTDTVHWIHDLGVRFLPERGRYAFNIDGRVKYFGGVVVIANGGGQAMVDTQYKIAEQRGITIRYDAQAIALRRGPRGIEAVRAIIDGCEDEISARAVVLACGGFEANREWRTKYLGAGWDMAKVRGTRYNTGDGIRMALEIGAQPHGQWSCAHAVSWERYAPDFGTLESASDSYRLSYPYGIMVNAEGRRFVDEGSDFRNYTYAKIGRIVLQQPGGYAWQIFDATAKPFHREMYQSRSATKVQANTLEELADGLDDVDRTQFLKTVREYNDAVKRDVPFDPTIRDGKCAVGLPIPKSNWANPIEKLPFEAYSVGCGITFTFGGVKINTSAQVLDVSDTPLPGLYAAGELVGGIWYFNYPGSGGLTAGAVFGRIAGPEAGRYAKS